MSQVTKCDICEEIIEISRPGRKYRMQERTWIPGMGFRWEDIDICGECLNNIRNCKKRTGGTR